MYCDCTSILHHLEMSLKILKEAQIFCIGCPIYFFAFSLVFLFSLFFFLRLCGHLVLHNALCCKLLKMPLLVFIFVSMRFMIPFLD